MKHGFYVFNQEFRWKPYVAITDLRNFNAQFDIVNYNRVEYQKW